MKRIGKIFISIIEAGSVILLSAQNALADLLPIGGDKSVGSDSKHKGVFDTFGYEHLVIGLAVVLVVVLSFVLFSKNRKK